MPKHPYFILRAIALFILLTVVKPASALTCNALFQDKSVIRSSPNSLEAELSVFLAQIKTIIESQHTSFQSKIASTAPIQSLERAQQVVEIAFQNPQFQDEFAKFLEKVGGIQSPELWNQYFKTYDQVVGYSDDYLTLILKAHNVLPQHGEVRDYGAGTGNFSAGLLSLGKFRKMKAIDMSPIGLQLAMTKMKAVSQNSKSTVEIADLKEYSEQSGDMAADGAVMNNVLYTFKGREQKLKVLTRIAEDLKDDAIFVLNDPRPNIQDSVIAMQNFITEVALSAAKNGSPMTEADLALLAAINKQVLISGASRFSSREDLLSIANEAGFEEISFGNGYYNRISTLILRKRSLNKYRILSVSIEEFHKSLSSTNANKTLAKRSIEELQNLEARGAKFYLGADGKIGWGITGDGEWISGFNMTGEKGLFALAAKKAIQDGVTWLRCVDGPLKKYWEKQGFEEIDRSPLNRSQYPSIAYAPTEKPMIVTMRLRPRHR